MSEKDQLRPGWKKGQSGNIKGKPKGTRNKATMLAMAIMEKGGKTIIEKVVEAAKGGDMQACRLIIERLVPPMRERPITLEFPDTSTTEGVSAAQQAILDAVGVGVLLPGEATTLSAIVEQRRKAIETQELEQRIAALEAKHEKP
jgi:Family of unknown function (DUF5681)